MDENMPVKAVAVISGGPDSISYAAIKKSQGYEIYPIIFDYGQKGRKEVEIAIRLSKELKFHEPLLVNISSVKDLWEGSQLTDENQRVEEEYKPSVVVPLRNAVFLLYASIYALKIGARLIIYGSHEDDITARTENGEPLYPDCSPAFSLELENALNLGHFPVYERKFEIWSPAREHMRKSELLKKGYAVMGDLIYETWSCYKSGEKHCGICESCRNRKKAFAEAGIPDKTPYES